MAKVEWSKFAREAHLAYAEALLEEFGRDAMMDYLRLVEEAISQVKKFPEAPKIFLHQDEKDIFLSLPYRFFNDVLGIDSLSQILANKARMEGFEGIIYNSVRKEGKCLALFTDRLLKDSSIKVFEKEDFIGVPNEKLEVAGLL